MKAHAANEDTRVWTFSGAEFTEQFDLICTRLHLEPLGPCLYALRHGGVSDDLATGRQTLADAKRRGRWRADKSLNRYGKETRLLAQLGKIPLSVIEFGRRVESNLALVLADGVVMRAPLLQDRLAAGRLRPPLP